MEIPDGAIRQDLLIPRGGRWLAHAWVLLDDNQQPITSEAAAGDLVVVAKIREHLTSESPVHIFSTSVVMLSLPDQYGADPVAAAQLGAIDHTVTAAWTWDVGVWDLLVDWEPKIAGKVSAPLLVSR